MGCVYECCINNVLSFVVEGFLEEGLYSVAEDEESQEI